MVLLYREREQPARHRSTRDTKKKPKTAEKWLFWGGGGNAEVRMTAVTRRCGRAGPSRRCSVGDKIRAGPCQDAMTSQEGGYC